MQKITVGRHRSRSIQADATKLLLAAVFLCLVLLPLLRMFSNLTLDSLRQVLRGEGFWTAAGHSLTVSLAATAASLLLAFILAFSVEKSSVPCKGLLRAIFVLPMLIPSISHGMGLILLFGNNGVLTNLFHFGGSIYGAGGIVLGSVMYAYPVAFLMLCDVLQYEDETPYEAASVLGLSRLRQLIAIRLPYLRRPLISIAFATFTLVITDYGVPLMVGGKYMTLPVVLYQEVIGQLNFGKGCVYGMFLLFPAVIAFLMDLMSRKQGNSAYVLHKQPMEKNRVRDVLAGLFCACAAVFTLLPVLSFLLLAFSKKYPMDMGFTLQNLVQTVQLGGGRYLINSILIALCVAVFGGILAFLTAYLTARMPSRASRLLHLACITSAAIPGIVLGLSYVLTFKATAVYGTLAILIMVNVVHFISSPYLILYNSLSKLNENLEAVGHTLGISRFYLIRDVILPQSRDSLLELFSYFFVNCMMTISAVSFLANTRNKPMALMINQFEAQMQLECAAVVSLCILLVNMAVRCILFACKSRKKESVR